MKVGVMQPYFFPYLGYWQLFGAVDKFVVLDDVNYIKRGYINSNSILINGLPHKFTIPLNKASQNKLIKDTKMLFSMTDRESFLKMIMMAYRKAPCFDEIYPVLEEIVMHDTDDLTEFIVVSFMKVKELLGLKTDILLSSEIKKNNDLKGEERIIEINKKLGADMYINAIGGQQLYSYEHFWKESIKLCFIKMHQYQYKQFDDNFVPNLSLIDVLMFNDVDDVLKMIGDYELLSE